MPRSKSTGRPRDVEQRERIDALLDVAASVFLERGFEAASVSDMAQRAQASKQSFYAHFPSKELLFLAVIDRRMTLMTNEFGSFLDENSSLRHVLLNIAQNYYKVVLGKDHLALLRVVYMEALRFPHIGQVFLEHGPGRVSSRLADFLSAQMEAGHLKTEQPQIAADHFLALVSGHSLQRALLGVPQQHSKKEIDLRIVRDVDCFLKIYTPK